MTETLGLKRITLKNGIVVMEMHDLYEHVYEYYLNRDSVMEFLVGVGENDRLYEDDLTELFVSGFFEV